MAGESGKKDVFIPSAKVDNMHLVQPPLPPKSLLHGYSLKKTREIFFFTSQPKFLQWWGWGWCSPLTSGSRKDQLSAED